MTDENINNGEGYLLAKISTGLGAIPVENATVTIYGKSENKNDILYVLTTNSVGLTQRVALPTPNKSLSMSPGNITPFSTYSVFVSADGFYSKENPSVNIFDSITAIENIDLTPLPESNIYNSEY